MASRCGMTGEHRMTSDSSSAAIRLRALMVWGRTLVTRTRAWVLRASATSMVAHMRSACIPDGETGIIVMSLASRAASMVEDAPGGQSMMLQWPGWLFRRVRERALCGLNSYGNDATVAAVRSGH